jgi:hypothetical protein
MDSRLASMAAPLLKEFAFMEKLKQQKLFLNANVKPSSLLPLQT